MKPCSPRYQPPTIHNPRQDIQMYNLEGSRGRHAVVTGARFAVAVTAGPAVKSRPDLGDDAWGLSIRYERNGVIDEAIDEALDGMDFVEYGSD